MDEYIDRESLIEWLKKIPFKDLSDGLGLCRVIMESDFKIAIKNIPEHIITDADVVPVKHGRWILVDTGKGIGVCSNCNRQDIIDPLATHCRFCGAMMEGETTLKNEMEAKEE